MKQAINAYRSAAASNELKEIERLRSRTRHNEASALAHAQDVERAKWEKVVVEKDTELAEKDAALAEKDALIAELKAQLGRDK